MAPVAETEVIKLKDETLVIKMQRRNSGGPKPKNDEEIDFEERQKIAHAYANRLVFWRAYECCHLKHKYPKKVK